MNIVRQQHAKVEWRVAEKLGKTNNAPHKRSGHNK